MAAAFTSVLGQFFPPKSNFSVSDIPDQTGRVVLVTGGNSGIGLETVKALLESNATVYLGARNTDKTRKCIEELKSKPSGKEVKFLDLDLSSLKSIKAAAEDFLSKEKELHVLANNAGVGNAPAHLVTQDGYDLTFGTNALGHFYLTQLLLPALKRAAQSSPDGKSRVVNVSSVLHLLGSLNFNTFKDGPARRKMSRISLYAQSKFANVVFSNELGRRYSEEGIVSIAVNPGNLKTPVYRNTNLILRFLINPALYPAPYGALTQLWASTSAEAANSNGKYLIPWAREGVAKKGTQNEKLGAELWAWFEEQTANV